MVEVNPWWFGPLYFATIAFCCWNAYRAGKVNGYDNGFVDAKEGKKFMPDYPD